MPPAWISASKSNNLEPSTLIKLAIWKWKKKKKQTEIVILPETVTRFGRNPTIVLKNRPVSFYKVKTKIFINYIPKKHYPQQLLEMLHCMEHSKICFKKKKKYNLTIKNSPIIIPHCPINAWMVVTSPVQLLRGPHITLAQTSLSSGWEQFKSTTFVQRPALQQP
jgi:hypothetical protein